MVCNAEKNVWEGAPVGSWYQGGDKDLCISVVTVAVLSSQRHGLVMFNLAPKVCEAHRTGSPILPGCLARISCFQRFEACILYVYGRIWTNVGTLIVFENVWVNLHQA